MCNASSSSFIKVGNFSSCDHYVAVRRGLRLDVGLVSVRHACFPPVLRDRLVLDVRLVCLSHVCFLPSLREGLGLDFRLVCLCHKFFPPTLRKGFMLDVRLVCLSCLFPSRLKGGAYFGRQTGLYHEFPSRLTRGT